MCKTAAAAAQQRENKMATITTAKKKKKIYDFFKRCQNHFGAIKDRFWGLFRIFGVQWPFREFFGKLHPDKQDVSSSIIKQLMGFWSESICEMDRDTKIGSRSKNGQTYV